MSVEDGFENFSVERAEVVGRWVGAQVLFPERTDFESRQIIVLEDVHLDYVYRQARLDPGFTEDGPIIARFRPDEKGWNNAVRFMCALANHYEYSLRH